MSIIGPNKTVRIDPTFVNIPSDYGPHSITIQISSSSNVSSVFPVTFNFTVEIKDGGDCTTTTMTFRLLADLSTNVGITNSLDISFNDAIGTTKNNQAFCGPRSFLLTPSPAFASISGNTLTINPILVADASTQNVTLAIGLANYSAVPTI